MKLITLLPVALLFTSMHGFASINSPDVVYGEDGRVEPYERPMLHTESRAVAAMVSKKHFNLESLLGFAITARSHAVDYNLCEGEKYEDQPILAHCSGFLVAPDVIMTAGHCIETQSDCDDFNWVFDYEMSASEGAPQEMKRENVFQCKSIISRSYGFGRPDYAIIKLDRSTAREPLKLLPAGETAASGDDIYMMGFPSGLPLKITEGGEVLSISNNQLVTNLDAFHVNSGSPVLDVKSNLVVGILVSGMPDYRSSMYGCNVVNTLEESRGQEKVTSLSVVPRKF